MASSSSSSPPMGEAEADVRHWAELPLDVTAAILQRVGSIDLLQNAQKVCTTWRSISKDPAMWRKIDMHNDTFEMEYDLEKMTRHAVDRSCGQLVDINIEHFGTDELLMYIADRASELRCLRLVCCSDISDEGLSEAAKKMPLLEELRIYYCSLSKEALESVGRCCPRLKLLKFNNQVYRGPHMNCDEEAQAIAESMPGLRELQLFGNKMTNDGLQAILDGCPHLESLDIRQCFNINLGGTLGKKCYEHIRKLREPYDSTDDYAFDATVLDMRDDDSYDDDYPSGLSNIDFLSDDDEYYAFSGGSDFSDYGELFFDD
ncbi:F-box protein SKIP19-like [Diospyros lotus]|uniref:F-box protein SKIP19-like n=1 Tax=Diospyros lotus TaxID=55363 RepID=UPI00224ECA11|nr:F-box protein SKIP19-like [Diospyros lotus]XP_052179700.1 F-box protein SKIP19-like [Diospyros lotus]